MERVPQADTEKDQDALQSEVEKRRRRIEAWQAQRKRMAEQSSGKEEVLPDGSEPNAGENEQNTKSLTWTLDDESEDEEHGAKDGLDGTADGTVVQLKEEDSNIFKDKEGPVVASGGGGDNDGDGDIDPLDAFMAENVLPEVEKANGMLSNQGFGSKQAPSKSRNKRPRPVHGRRPSWESEEEELFGSEGEGSLNEEFEDEDEDDDLEWARKVQSGKLSKGDRLGVTDHSKIEYPPFRRNFYIEVPELARMTANEVEAYRKTLDGIKIRGKDVPKPIKTWTQCGLSTRILEVLRKAGFEKPLPIQAQALPVIMGGRDCIGIAKTGSGKTLAFVLPLIRHVKDQPALRPGDGPIGLIMAPTRELVTQIGKEVKRFAKVAGLSCATVYGGSGVANQISELKRGSEIVVCTPGRMIDILATGSGKITNLRRVTYLVLDEADRMFDMGFEPQIMRMVNNVRPDRQTVLFSATFPRAVESLARQVLINPVEIQVGGRSVVNPDITQFIEIRAEGERFLRLLELLGEWYERGKILIFVSSQDRCDSLFRDLLRSGYPCLSLHGGKDQSDRESTISDFKSAVCNVLVATSVAARGLDVKDLMLVVNYDCPNHHEDYVHRVGRTGRAGAKGTAVTFIAPDEDQYAPDLVKALKESGAPIPSDVAALAEGFERKRAAGLAKSHGSGFGGSGFKFDKAEDDMIRALKRATARQFGVVEESEEEEEEEVPGSDEEGEPADQGIREVVAAEEAPSKPLVDLSTLPAEMQARVKAAQAIAEKLVASGPPSGPTPGPQTTATSLPAAPVASTPLLAAAQAAAQRLAAQIPSTQTGGVAANISAAAAAALQAMGVTPTGSLVDTISAGSVGGGVGGAGGGAGTQMPTPRHFEAELEINDFPQNARWKVTHRETIRDIGEQLGAAIVVKGRYIKPGMTVQEGDRKLYLYISGPTAEIVRRAKAEIKHILEESTEKAMRRDAPAAGRYSIV